MKKYIYLTLISLAVLTGCKDFLEEAPVLSQSDKLTLSTFDGLNKSTAGAYGPISGTSWYGNTFIVMNEMMTSNGKKWIGSAYDSGRLKEFYNIKFDPNTTSPIWGSAYYVISAVNNVMANLDGKGDPQALNNLKAECLFLRAFSHFDLVRTYAMPYNYTEDASHPGVPVILEPQDPNNKPARETVAKVYESIIADLLEARSIIDPAYERADAADPKAFVTLPAINALLSRAYLYTEQWQNAADAAMEVINDKSFKLWTKEEMKDGECYTSDLPVGGEIIFEIYGDKKNSHDGHNDGLSPITTPDGYGDAGCSKDLMSLYEEGDLRGKLFIEKDGCTWTSKYAGKDAGTPDVTNVPILRLSEMYLNVAEAVANGASGDGVGLLKKLAEARGATPQNCTKAGVYLERQKELAWEGHLWFDLARTGRDMTRTDYLGDDSGKKVEAGSYKWAMPIPLRETGVNPNLVQNEGY